MSYMFASDSVKVAVQPSGLDNTQPILFCGNTGVPLHTCARLHYSYILLVRTLQEHG